MAELKLPEGTNTYRRRLVDSELMIEVEPFLSVNETAFPKIYAVKDNVIVHKKFEASRDYLNA